MAGGHYTALSGMRARLDALDRLAADIANASTSGYKTERAGTSRADRPSFGAALQAAVDVANNEAVLDLRPGPLASTGRAMDVAIQGRGFFVVETEHGVRYTRDGHLIRRADGVLATSEGHPVLGKLGQIRIATGDVTIDPDGTVRNDGSIAGTLRVVEFEDGARIERDAGAIFRADREPAPAATVDVASGSLEQSNVSIVERVAELSDVSRSFETLLRSVAVLMNDIDKGAIAELSRK
jgi:flagellar basal body rod protein FlgG